MNRDHRTKREHASAQPGYMYECTIHVAHNTVPMLFVSENK